MHHDFPSFAAARGIDRARMGREARNRFVSDNIVKQFDKPAQNQRAILSAFQREGWPPHIENPLEHDRLMDDSQRMADAVYRLNRDQKPLRICFRRDGRGLGITWELVKKKKR
jgi:hypothetical protein